MKVSTLLNTARDMVTKNSPHILTGLGCAGLVTTAVLTGTAVPEAMRIVEEKGLEEEPLLEKAKATWKVYIPAVVTGAVSIACIIGANAVNTRRNAALAALYSMTDTAFKDYKQKVVEEIGRAKEGKIRDAVMKDKIDKHPASDKEVIFTGSGDILCYDVLSDRYFQSSYETIRGAVNTLNFDLINHMWIPLNDLYSDIGLEPTKLGYDVGFDLSMGQVDPHYSTQLSDKGVPCLVLDLDVYPRKGY